jgi:hypothetical protein
VSMRACVRARVCVCRWEGGEILVIDLVNK